MTRITDQMVEKAAQVSLPKRAMGVLAVYLKAIEQHSNRNQLAFEFCEEALRRYGSSKVQRDAMIDHLGSLIS